MQIDGVVCAFCGCDCDDIQITIENDRITQTKNACVLGKAWFMGHSQPQHLPMARVYGKEVPLEEAIEKAVRILTEARYPMLYGLSSTSCEAQRAAIALTEAISGTLDCCTSVCHGPSGMAFQGIGEPTSTLGEVKNRADLIIYWGSNPAESHPRHMARYAVTAKGKFIPNGRKDRTVVMVDVRPTPSARAADIFLQIAPGKDFEVLWALRGLVKGINIDPESLAGTGISLEQLTDLAERMKNCRFGAFFIGQGLTQTKGKHMNTGATFLLTRDLNSYTKFVLIPMRGHGNVTGIDSVLAWQTGYPFGVNFSRNYPRFNPGEFTMVDVLSRGEADAALIIASDPFANLPDIVRNRLRQIPTIALDTHESETTCIATVAIITSTAGINVDGTVYRMDNIPLPLSKLIPSQYPSDEEVLQRMLARAKELKPC